MRIGIYANPIKDPSYAVSGRAASLIRAMGGQAVVDPDVQEMSPANLPDACSASYSTCDLLMCLGGDGTFLSAVHADGCAKIPFIGVNLGSVGFLLEILPESLETAIRQLISGNYHLEKRMMLDVACFDASQHLLEEGFALNDAVISRGGKSRIVTLELTVNQEIVDKIPGDGLIVSTPTGSTAYSLSSGGPIIHPELSLLLITPICPHTLHNRSYIAAENSQVIVRICDYPHQALLAIDGRQEIYLGDGSSVVIRRSAQSLTLIRLGNDNFYATLPEKIQARGKTK